MTNPIRAALERLIELNEECTEEQWTDAIAAARAALAEQQGEGPTLEEVEELLNRFAAFNIECLQGLINDALARWGHQPTPPAEGEVAKPQKASTAELTANIQIDTSPECLQRLIDGLNAAVKPDGGYRAQTTDDPMVQTGCEQMVGVEWWLPQYGCDSLENTIDAIKGRILTAVFKWWPTATVSATQPPAEGEVAEFITQLKSYAEYGTPIRLIPFVTDRAAELLQQQEAEIKRLKAQQAPVPEEAANPWKDALIDALVCAFLLNEENQSDPRRALHDLISWEVQLARDPLINPPVHPTPVPVAERLPGPGDRNTEGKCWWFCTAYLGEWPHWILGNEAFCDPTHWLPAHALPLPLPQGEAQR